MVVSDRERMPRLIDKLRAAELGDWELTQRMLDSVWSVDITASC